MSLLREYIREQLLLEKNVANNQLEADILGEIGEFMDTRQYDDVLDDVFKRLAPNLVRHVLEQDLEVKPIKKMQIWNKISFQIQKKSLNM